jgi:hypothetical protein
MQIQLTNPLSNFFLAQIVKDVVILELSKEQKGYFQPEKPNTLFNGK